MNKIYFNENEKNNRGDKKSPPKKSFDLYKKNTMDSLRDVESFLNNFHHYFKYLKIYKILKK